MPKTTAARITEKRDITSAAGPYCARGEWKPANRRAGTVAGYHDLVVKAKSYKAGTPAKSICLPR
jgi:hypothetical protein